MLKHFGLCSICVSRSIQFNVENLYLFFFLFIRLLSCPLARNAVFLKQKQVYDSTVLAYPPIVHQHGLVTTVLGLHMQLDSTHFDDGLMRIKCLTSVSPLIALHSSSSSAEGNAAEARESAYTNGNINRKTNYGQRKPPLTDSREVFLLGKYIINGIFTSEMKMMIISAFILFVCTLNAFPHCS